MTTDEFEEEVAHHLQQMSAREEAKRRFAAEQEQAGSDDDSMLYTDVAAMLDGNLPESPRPEFLTRTDGVSLFYPGEVNLLFGDPEHGKTWVALAACAEALIAGRRVVVADLDHNGANAILARLLMLGAPKEALREPEHFRHCEPGDVSDVSRMVADCATWRPEVVMVDSTGELLPMFGANSDNGDDFTRVHRKALQPIANAGASVLLVDHLAKGRDSRVLGPGGSMAKRRTVGGLSLRVDRERPFSPSAGGSARLLVNKDRHGGVRDRCAELRQGKDVEQLAGVFVLDPTSAVDTWRVLPPDSAHDGEGREFRPTVLMERASRAIEENPREFTKDKLATEVTGRKEHLRLAVELLEREEYVTKTEERYPRYTSRKPYRESDDPQSDQHVPLGGRLRRHRNEQDGGDQDG